MVYTYNIFPVPEFPTFDYPAVEKLQHCGWQGYSIDIKLYGP